MHNFRSFFERQNTRYIGLFLAAILFIGGLNSNASAEVLPAGIGFNGIWYANESSGDKYAYKYSGGMATYPQQTSPLAIYSAEANKTFFVYGGATSSTANDLRNYISYFDHSTGLLARPLRLRNPEGNTSDNHQNATLTIDATGNLFVFANSHGSTGEGNLYKSAQPYSISEFNELPLPYSIFGSNNEINLSYSAPYYIPGQGIMMVYSQYADGRAVHVARSSDGGLNWQDQRLFDTGDGHYSISRTNGTTFSVSADFHNGSDLDNRTNLYYFQTKTFGTTWTNAAGTPITLPSDNSDASRVLTHPALVHDYLSENQLVYMKDIDYDAAGNPILLYLTVLDSAANNFNGHKSGPQPGGRTLHTARWTGAEWLIRDVIQTDHNYDHGEMVVEQDGTWRLTGTFIDGPQVYGTGGQVGEWISTNQGLTWSLNHQLTFDTKKNHNYVRNPLNANDDFANFWADGNAFTQSSSSLYFSNKEGDVFRMPNDFGGADFAAPILVWSAIPEPSSVVCGMIGIAAMAMLAKAKKKQKEFAKIEKSP